MLSNALLAPMTEIESALASALEMPTGERSLDDAMRYAVLGGGKRVRPLLAWHSCEACGSPGSASLPAGVAIELVHAFSLVHDDLPAMDDDDLRRGRPTVHIQFGEAMAILAGDALLNLAYRVLVGVNAARVPEVVRILADATGRMIRGQVLDIEHEGREGTAAIVREIHTHKTGALIGASCELGAVCAGAEAGLRGTLREFGECLGLLFQATDDLIDVEQASEHAGKATGKDKAAGKLTLPGTRGVEEARREIGRLEGRCREILATLGDRGRVLVEITEAVASRTR